MTKAQEAGRVASWSLTTCTSYNNTALIAMDENKIETLIYRLHASK